MSIPTSEPASRADRLLTPSKITAWLDCAHYLTLRDQVDAGVIAEPASGFGAFARLLMEKGLLHERQYLDRLRAEGRTVYEVPERHERESFARWAGRVGDTLAVGHDVVYQMPFVHDGLRGVADFLVRVDEPSSLGSFRYEPVDAKLARADAKPGHVLQPCFYADALAVAQGAPPQRVHLHLGSGRTESIRLVDVQPYWRRLREQLRRLVEAEHPADTEPIRCAHCEFCEFASTCEDQWRTEDSLYFVAGIRSPEISALDAAGVETMAELAQRVDPVAEIRDQRLDVLRRQAWLQRTAAADGQLPWEPIGIVDATQRDRVPAPDDGDVFLDFEGHPFWTPADDLFFLFGLLTKQDDGWDYEARWAHDPSAELTTAAELITWLAERHAIYPGMHVYHYNHTERSSLQRLAAERGAGEQVMAAMVANGVFVDVLDVVRHAVLIGTESYSLKRVELLTDFVRSHEIDAGAGAVIEYDEWTRDGVPSHLERIARYNEDDVRATVAVRDWLVSNPLHDTDWRDTPTLQPEDEQDVDVVVASLIATDEPWKALLAQLLEYWAREGRAHRAQHLAMLGADHERRLDDPNVVADLTFLRWIEPVGKQKGARTLFSFPPQELAPELIDGSDQLMFPAGPDGIVVVSNVGADVEAGTLTVVWGGQAAEVGVVPSDMVRNDWVNTRAKSDAAYEIATAIADGTASFPAIEGLLARGLPHYRVGGGPSSARFTADKDEIVEAAVALERSVLAVQGPPGTGKTYVGAMVIRRLVAARKRVGVTAFSHHAINNLLRECLDHEPTLRILRQGSKPPQGAMESFTYNATREKWDTGDHDIVAGTSWMFANPKMRHPPAVDVLVIDEAGQYGLADAVAAMGSAHNAILLGDPLQLAQVTIASHPGGSDASALQHLLGDAATMPPERGAFLDATRRMHPAVCEYISTQIYDGRLVSHPDCARQSVGGETGLRWIQATHTGNSTRSPQEAAMVAETIRELIGQTWVDWSGAERPTVADDVMVVAPYNDQVDLVRAALDEDPTVAGARVGTVDRFQGQEAPVVIFTMATSSAADMPRTPDFLFSRNRLNVAVSRARALAYVICTEQLLDTRATDVEEMKLISTLCALVESALHR